MHGLVNNAGVPYRARLMDMDVAGWDRVIGINLTGTMLGMRTLVPLMPSDGTASIVNIGSIAGLHAHHALAYTVSKWGMRGLTKVAALETARSGVTVNAICPGWVLTPLVQKQIDDLATREAISTEDATLKLLGEKQPSGRFATVEQIGGVAAFLCSESASEMRGSEIKVDGGWIAQ